MQTSGGGDEGSGDVVVGLAVAALACKEGITGVARTLRRPSETVVSRMVLFVRIETSRYPLSSWRPSFNFDAHMGFGDIRFLPSSGTR